MKPSVLEIVSLVPNPKMLLCIPNPMSRTEAIMFSGMSLLRLSRLMPTGRMRAVMPRMRRTLKRLDPITFPMAMSALPCVS